MDIEYPPPPEKPPQKDKLNSYIGGYCEQKEIEKIHGCIFPALTGTKYDEKIKQCAGTLFLYEIPKKSK